MPFQGNRACRAGVLGISLLALSVSYPGDIEDRTDTSHRWRDLGVLLLSGSGAQSSPLAKWLERELDVADPNSGTAVRSAAFLLMKTLDGYGQDAMAIQGRISLDVNPQCILGLYATERFPGTRIGDWGGRQFERCVEQACAATMLTAGGTGPARLEAELLGQDQAPHDPPHVGTFARTEVPYLYLYIARVARSVDARHQARKRLARYLWEEYGLGPGLNQYLILLKQGCRADGTWLEVATQLDRSGSRQKAKELYGQIIRNAAAAEETRKAAEGLARILISESRQEEAGTILGTLFERSPNVQWAGPDIKSFWKDFRLSREETSRQLTAELSETTSEPQALQLCRLLDALWTPEEAPRQWQAVVNGAEVGSLAEQFGRVFLAMTLLGAGKADAAQAMVRELAESVNPFLQARSVAVMAEVARVKGDAAESARLYSKAIQISRPTPLPGWYRSLVRVPPWDARMPAPELQVWMCFLKACNHLIDGDFAAAADSLVPAAADSHSVPDSLRCLVPCTMALAYWGIGDCTEAEAWGFRALEECQKDDPNDGGIPELLAKIHDMETTIRQLVTGIRHESTHSLAAPVVREQAIRLCNTATDLEAFGSRAQTVGDRVQQLYVQAKKRQIAQTLMAEYRWVRQRGIGSGGTEYPPVPEPLLFAAQVLGGDSFERVRESLAAVAEDEGVKGRMYRLIKFAREVNRPDLARGALDVAAGEQTPTANAEVLEDLAQMYLDASHHQKAIALYKMVAANLQDADKAKSAQLKIITLYVEDLKNPGQAMQECEEFIRRYPGDPQTCQVEFLMGRLAYLNKDYAGAVGQLDGFQKRYPGHPQVGQAMVLAGLSRMAEGNTQEAVGRFSEVIRRYPDGDLAARSKFLIGYAQISEQQYSAATETLQQLLEQFPDSQYAAQARTLIDRLSKISP